MKVWVFLEGRQQGPFEFEQLYDMPVTPDTKVWYEGLPKWYPAGELDAMAPLFRGSGNTVQNPAPETETVETVIETEEPAAAAEPDASKYAPGRRYIPRQRPEGPCPPTYIGWSVFLTICCCSPVSLAALVASICVSSNYNGGRMRQARKASEVAAWLVMIAIALGMLPVMLMSALF